MMKFFVLPLLFSYQALATIIPENNLSLPVSEKYEDLKEEEYHRVIDRIQKIYGPSLRIKKYPSRLIDSGKVRL